MHIKANNHGNLYNEWCRTQVNNEFGNLFEEHTEKACRTITLLLQHWKDLNFERFPKEMSRIWHEISHFAWFQNLYFIWGKCPDHFKDLNKLNLLTNFDVNLTSSPEEVMNWTFNTLLITPPVIKADWHQNWSGASVYEDLWNDQRIFLKWSRSSKIMHNVIFHVKL